MDAQPIVCRSRISYEVHCRVCKRVWAFSSPEKQGMWLAKHLRETHPNDIENDWRLKQAREARAASMRQEG